MTPEGLSQLIDDEGTRLFVYDDATGRAIVPGSYVSGHPTIGVGRALDVQGISDSESSTLLEDDVSDLTTQLQQLEWFNTLNGTRQDVIVNMAYNLGLDGMLGFHHMIGAIQAGDFAEAAVQILNSDEARRLPARYQRLHDAMLSGVWSS